MTDTWNWPSINNAQLARYVTPNRAVAALGFTPAVPDQTANDLLNRGEHSTLVSRIYEDLVARKISYSLEPVVASTIVQRIRPPESVLGSATRPGEGTCLDLALLLAGLCQHRWLRPVVVVFRDHAIALVSIIDRFDTPYPITTSIFVGGISTDAAALRDIVDNHSHLAIECTGFAVTKTSGDVRRNADGTLSFADACLAGHTSLDARELRFGIDPIELHRAGILPDDQVLQLDERVDEFLRGAAQAKGAVEVISGALPQVTETPSRSELAAIKGALDEVLKTYDVVLEVSKEWIEAAVADGGSLDSATISALTTGDLVERIRDRRGHCGRIGELYWNEGGRDYFARQLVNDPRLIEIDAAFDELTGVDYAFFDRAQEAGKFLQDTVGQVLDAMLAGDQARVQTIVRASAKHVAVLQQAVAANRRQLKELAQQLGIDVADSSP